MTTVLADLRLGVMVADSNICDDDRVWFGRKVFRIRGALLGFAGVVDEAIAFREWWRGGMSARKPRFAHSQALVLTGSELLYFDNMLIPEPVRRGREAIGTGGKAAMCAYEAMGFEDPGRAVRIVCRHDAGSRGPVRIYRLNQG